MKTAIDNPSSRQTAMLGRENTRADQTLAIIAVSRRKAAVGGSQRMLSSQLVAEADGSSRLGPDIIVAAAIAIS
jgi:hypothetical protein